LAKAASAAEVTKNTDRKLCKGSVYGLSLMEAYGKAPDDEGCQHFLKWRAREMGATAEETHASADEEASLMHCVQRATERYALARTRKNRGFRIRIGERSRTVISFTEPGVSARAR